MTAAERLARAQWAFAETFSLLAAAELGLFEALRERPLDLRSLSKRLHASERGLDRLLEALVGLGLVVRAVDEFELAPGIGEELPRQSDPLLPDRPFLYLRPTLERWLGLTETVRTGRPAARRDRRDRTDFFRQLVPDLYRINLEAAELAAAELAPGLPRFDVAALDVAAGSGVFGIALAKRHAGVVVTALDHGEVLEITRRFVEQNDLVARFHYLPGDLRTVELASDLFDVAFLGHILHSEGEQHAQRLVRRVSAALRPGGTVVIGEFLLDDDHRGPLIPLLFGLNMLVHTEEGAVFSFGQIEEWLADAGFEQVRALPVPGRSPLMLAEKRAS